MRVFVEGVFVTERYRLVAAEELCASLQGVRTSKDRSDTRHQGIRIECYVLIVITTGEVRNKRIVED
jgi:hypothetical protein